MFRERGVYSLLCVSGAPLMRVWGQSCTSGHENPSGQRAPLVLHHLEGEVEVAETSGNIAVGIDKPCLDELTLKEVCSFSIIDIG